MREHRIDLYLAPQGISDYGLLDYHQCDRIMRQSYKYGCSVVREWKRRRGTADAHPMAVGAAGGGGGGRARART